MAALVNGVNRKVAPLKLGMQNGNPELDFLIRRCISGPAPGGVEYSSWKINSQTNWNTAIAKGMKV